MRQTTQQELEEFLQAKGVLTQFAHHVAMTHYHSIDRVTEELHRNEWLSCVFDWDNTDEGFHFWAEIDLAWADLLNTPRNLKRFKI